jgi:uncharacterized protein YecE (DUF72 family)
MAGEGRIRCGIGGWTFEPWRGVFYPKGLKQADELAYASRRLTAIEINGTYYSSFKPDSWAKWRAATPDGFKFSVKASRFCTNRKVLSDGKGSMDIFLGQGLTELGDRLGPILWQFMGTKQFDPDDFGAFLKLLPKAQDGVKLRHAVEPRHDSFRCPEFIEMARAAGVGIVFAEAEAYPCIADLSGDFVYARLQCSREEEPLGYSAQELDCWAEAAKAWSRGEAAPGFPCTHDDRPEPAARDTYVLFIAGAKVRNPLAAQALIERL